MIDEESSPSLLKDRFQKLKAQTSGTLMLVGAGVMFGLAELGDLMRSHTKPTFGPPLSAPHQQETLRTQMEFGAEHAPG
jgi:hypothetical protein